MHLVQNHLIRQLPADSQHDLLAHCTPVDLTLGQVLVHSGQPVADLYFPVDAFCSLLSRLDGHPGVEVGMAGREGLVGATVLLGQPASPWQVLVQGAGSAWRMDRAAFMQALVQAPTLHSLVCHYLFATVALLASSAACLRFHAIGPRLARWLLMSQDRAHAPQFRVTHEFLSSMLGVRRAGVTQAASQLQLRGLIHYRRGEMRIVDRPGLEAAACSCYARDCALHASAMGLRVQDA